MLSEDREEKPVLKATGKTGCKAKEEGRWSRTQVCKGLAHIHRGVTGELLSAETVKSHTANAA